MLWKDPSKSLILLAYGFSETVEEHTKIKNIGLAYDGGTTALGAVRLGSTPSSPTIQNKSNFGKRLPRGFAPRHLRVPQGRTRQIATVRKNPFGLSGWGGGGAFQFFPQLV